MGRDTSYNLAGALAPAFFTLIVTPFYLHIIGADRFGILAICWTTVGALGFTSLGMGPALTYRMALMDKDAPILRSDHVWAALLIGFAASLLGSILVLAIARAYFEHFASLPSRLRQEIWSALPFLAVLLPIATLSGVLSGALQGRKRFGALSAITVLNAGVATITPLLVALLLSPELPNLIRAMAAANALVLMVQFATCTRMVPLQFPTRLGTDHAKALVTYGAWMSATALVAPFLLLFDRFVIGALRGLEAVAIYALAFNVLQGLLLLPASLSSAMLPRLAPLTRAEDVRHLQRSWLIWLNGVLTPAAIIGIAASGPFLRLWIGPILGSAASPVAAILLVGCWVHGIGHIPATVAIGRNRPDLLTKLLLLYLLPYLVLLYLGTAMFGIVGAASAWTIRAVFDPLLFFYSRPSRSETLQITLSAVLVVAAMVTALAFTWTWPVYWVLMGLLIAASSYQNRKVLISSIDGFRKLAFQG